VPNWPTRDGTRPTEMGKNGVFKAVLLSSTANRLARIVKHSGKVLWTHRQLRIKFVTNGPTRDGTRPAKMGKNGVFKAVLHSSTATG